MEFHACLYPFFGDSLSLIESLVPKDKRRIVNARWYLSIGDPMLETILQQGESAEGFWISADTRLSAAERKQVSHFEIVSRKVAAAMPEDCAINEAVRDRTPLQDRGGPEPIRLLSGMSLSQIKLKPNMAGSVADMGEEYLIGTAVQQVFAEAGFTGYSLLPVYDTSSGKVQEGFGQIYSESVLQPAVLDCSVEKLVSDSPEENGKLRHLGCLTYRASDLRGIPDFNRSAEPWGGWYGYPSWVVSAEVANLFRRNRLRGWEFRPVFTRESELYATYLEQWNRLHSLVDPLSLSSFDGGR